MKYKTNRGKVALCLITAIKIEVLKIENSFLKIRKEFYLKIQESETK